jgi:four helix bundle protein
LQKAAVVPARRIINERFMEISLRSTHELETQLLIAQAVQFGDPHSTNELLNDIAEQQKMIISFMNKLNK